MWLYSCDLYIFLFIVFQNKVYVKQFLQDSLGIHSYIYMCVCEASVRLLCTGRRRVSDRGDEGAHLSFWSFCLGLVLPGFFWEQRTSPQCIGYFFLKSIPAALQRYERWTGCREDWTEVCLFGSDPELMPEGGESWAVSFRDSVELVLPLESKLKLISSSTTWLWLEEPRPINRGHLGTRYTKLCDYLLGERGGPGSARGSSHFSFPQSSMVSSYFLLLFPSLWNTPQVLGPAAPPACEQVSC